MPSSGKVKGEREKVLMHNREMETKRKGEQERVNYKERMKTERKQDSEMKTERMKKE